MKRLSVVALSTLMPLVMNAQISVTIGDKSAEYRTFTNAVYAVNAAAADTKPQMKLKGNVYVSWDEDAPAFTHSVDIDLNGMRLSSPMSGFFAVDGEGVVVTLSDKSLNGLGGISFNSEASEYVDYAVMVRNGQLQMESGVISSSHRSESCGCVWVVEGGSFVMNGGIVTNTSMKDGRAIMNEGGTVVINDGTVSAYTRTEDTSSRCYGIYNNENGSLTVNYGVIDSRAEEHYAYDIYAENGKMLLEDGIFTATDIERGVCVYLGNADVTINGGKYIKRNDDANYYDISGGNASKVKINGGYFSKEGSLQKFIGDKYLAVLPKNAPERELGCELYITDEKPVEYVVKNLNSEKGYETLEAAMDEAVDGDIVALQQDYTLTKDLTVKKGVILLVPFDMVNTCYTDYPNCAWGSEKPVLYRTFTIADGVKLTVDGGLSVSASMTALNGGDWGTCGSVFGRYALVSLGKDAEISVNGSLYCYGYIAGDGKVVMEENSTLYENFQFTDFRGGNRSSTIYEKMFVFQQYYVQNIEAPLYMKKGVRDITTSALNAVGNNFLMHDIMFIGEGGFFIPGAETTFKRTYDGTTDRIRYEVDGDVTLGVLSLGIESLKYTSENVPCPLNNNMTIEMKSGTLKMERDYTAQPGAQILIGEKAQLQVCEDASLYVIDRDDWGHFSKFGYVYPMEYTIANGASNWAVRWGTTKKSGFTEWAWNAMDDAVLDVNGKATIIGNLMCSTHGAKVVSSSGTGVFDFAHGITDMDTVVYTNINNTFDLDSIAVSQPQFTAPDGTVIKAEPGKAVRYTCQGAEWKATPIILIDDITALIADYLEVGTTVIIDDITDLIRRYLEQ